MGGLGNKQGKETTGSTLTAEEPGGGNTHKQTQHTRPRQPDQAHMLTPRCNNTHNIDTHRQDTKHNNTSHAPQTEQAQ